jgi:hypothetical protein
MNSLTALLIFLILCFPLLTLVHHVIFKEIGEMEGALFYMHAVTFLASSEPSTIIAPGLPAFGNITTSCRIRLTRYSIPNRAPRQNSPF